MIGGGGGGVVVGVVVGVAVMASVVAGAVVVGVVGAVVVGASALLAVVAGAKVGPVCAVTPVLWPLQPATATAATAAAAIWARIGRFMLVVPPLPRTWCCCDLTSTAKEPNRSLFHLEPTTPAAFVPISSTLRRYPDCDGRH